MSKDSDHSDLPPSGDRVSALWQRLKEHRIAQWSVGYVAVAYGIQHAVTLTSEAFQWPNLVVRISMLVLILGLPVAMALAWYHGERINRRISGPELAIISILLVIASLAFYNFVRPSEQIVARPVAPAQAVTAVAPPVKPGGISVAVLPFINMSGDPKEEFFSDGMTEEITAALAQVKGLRVIGRTSAFAFKGKNEDLRVIGNALGATDVIEGSVRKEGNQLRITVQLIKVDDDSHLWAQSYDRELKDVFAVQEDVAKSIAAALQVPLGLNQGETLVSNRTGDTQSYEDYLRALALYRARNIKDVIAILEPMVGRDPNYAPAWALLAQAYNLVPVFVQSEWGPTDQVRRARDVAFGKGEMAARKAIALDPKYAFAYAVLGYLNDQREQWAEGDGNFQRALALDPTDPDALHLYGLSLMAKGRLNAALKVRTTLRKVEPFVPIYNVFTALAMQLNGDIKGAIPILEGLPADGPVSGQHNGFLALAYAAQGSYAAAADTILKTPPDQTDVSMPAAKQAADIIRKAPATVVATGPTPASESNFSFVYAFVGAPERFLDAQEWNLEAGSGMTPVDWLAWHPSLSAVRKTQRFKILARKKGLVDYWRATSWPDLCHPVGADDFACN